MTRRVLCMLFVVVLFTTAWGPPLQGGDNPTVNRRLHFPILMNEYASGPEPLVDLDWQWGDINLAPGSAGIKVLDWDHDGTNDILVAHQDMIFAVRHAGDYRFEQFGRSKTAEPGALQISCPVPTTRCGLLMPPAG